MGRYTKQRGGKQNEPQDEQTNGRGNIHGVTFGSAVVSLPSYLNDAVDMAMRSAKADADALTGIGKAARLVQLGILEDIVRQMKEGTIPLGHTRTIVRLCNAILYIERREAEGNDVTPYVTPADAGKRSGPLGI